MSPSLSIVIPAFNEAGRIAATLTRISGWLQAHRPSSEIVVVDDGSADATVQAVRAAVDGLAAGAGTPPVPIRLLPQPTHRGKGHALRCGIAAAGGQRLLCCDADLSTPIEMLPRLEAALDAGADIAIASRDLPQSRLQPPQPPLRRLMAGAFRSLRRRLLLPDIRDTQCGFKLLSGASCRPVAADCQDDGWLFDLEFLVRAERRGLDIREIGVDWCDARPSRVRPLMEVLRTLRTLRRLGRVR